MGNPKVCEDCGEDFDGRKKFCPHCQEAQAVMEANDLLAKTQALEEQRKSDIAVGGSTIPPARSDAAVMLELSKSMVAMTSGMQSMMTELTETLKEVRLSKRRDRSRTPERRHRSPARDPPAPDHRTPGGTCHKAGCSCGNSGVDPRTKSSWNDLGDLWDGTDILSDILQRSVKKKSKFDIIRYLPECERKKQNPIDSSEKLISLLTQLIDDIHDTGEDTKGLRKHMIYVATMAATGIYDIKALVSYDAAVRDKADKDGLECVTGVDTNLSNFHLGYAGTKHARNLKNAGGSSSNSQGGQGRPRKQGNKKQGQNQGFTGWRKYSADQGCCFTFGAGVRQCEGCDFKHECAYCNSTSHGMLHCKQHDGAQGKSG